MINVYNQVPSVYINTSRDFQYLSWLINIVLNAVKHDVDDLYELPNVKIDNNLTELLAMTLGFKVRRNYDQNQLAALVSIIPSILKCKGTKKAITIAGEALVAASGASGDFVCDYDSSSGTLIVTFPEDLVDIMLFMDLLPYILPAGIACKVVKKNVIKRTLNTTVYYNDKHLAYMQPDVTWDPNKYTSAGLATLADIDETESPISFANYTDTGDGNILNAGLLDNSIIPILKDSFGSFENPNDDK